MTKFLESLNSIAASSLEGSAWFGRTLQVVTHQDQSSDLEEESVTSTDKSSTTLQQGGDNSASTPSSSSLPPPPPTPSVAGGSNSKASQFSVPAILILAEVSKKFYTILHYI